MLTSSIGGNAFVQDYATGSSVSREGGLAVEGSQLYSQPYK